MAASEIQTLIACRVCAQVHEEPELPAGHAAHCERCGSELKRSTPHGLNLTAAFTLSALLLYFPANLFPILRMELYGRLTENTVFSGVVRFWQDGDIFVAIIVFLASVLIPFLKIAGLLFLTTSSIFQWRWARPWRTHLYRAIDGIGRWAMLDVFALAILVSLIKMGKMATVMPGPGVIAFVLVVLFTLFASWSYDPQTIWEET